VTCYGLCNARFNLLIIFRVTESSVITYINNKRYERDRERVRERERERVGGGGGWGGVVSKRMQLCIVIIRYCTVLHSGRQCYGEG
jgi:hypothetical protein